MKILFWVPYPIEGASNRYRIEQYLPYLRQAGIRFSVRSFWGKGAFSILYKEGYYLRKAFFFLGGTFSRIFDLFRIFIFDAVFIHRESYPLGVDILEGILYAIKKPIIFDFDDAVFLAASSPQNNFIERFKRPSKVSEIIRKSSRVIAGNNYLREFALRYNSLVTVIPTAIDTSLYVPVASARTSAEVTIGWMGSVTTAGFLKDIAGVFKALSVKFLGIRFKIVGGSFFVPGVDIISKQWSMRDELKDLETFDIGIMPMPDNKWTRGKCGFKAILYMSKGIPCVCSPVGMNKEIITDGINGFLADKEKDWIKKLTLLVDDPLLRRTIGDAGRKTVEERYSVKANAGKFLAVINSIFEKDR